MNGNDHPQGPVLQAYFDGELSPAEAATVEAHGRVCGECREVLAELAAVQERLAFDRPSTIQAPMWPAVAARVERESSHRLGPAFTFGAVAACAAGIVLGLLVGTPSASQQASSEQVVWTSASQLWSESGSTSLLDVYSGSRERERSDGS